MYASYNFMLVMSILAMSLEHRFCISRKGRWVDALEGSNSIAAFGLSCRKPLVSNGWAISLLFTKLMGLENGLLAM